MKKNKPIRVAIIGVGNCASSLVQGIYYYNPDNNTSTIGLMHEGISDYRPCDIEVVVAFDIDARKVGQPLNKAILAKPNCTKVFCDNVPENLVTVQMGAVFDGFSDHMSQYPEHQTFVLSEQTQLTQTEIVKVLRDNEVDVIMNYLPVGSQQATEFYAECALQAGAAFVNNIPVFIASNPLWAKRFTEAGLPIIGDDIKAQLGATITHRTLTELFMKRGVKINRTYQLNTGGNTDFLNMLNRDRLEHKKKSKTEAVTSLVGDMGDNIHVGPSDYVPWQNDNKLCFLRMEGELFGGVPMNLELRLSVEDSPNSAGVAIDSIRCAKVALDRGLAGPIEAPSAYFCKHPPVQYTDSTAYQMTEAFIKGEAFDAAKREDSNLMKAQTKIVKLKQFNQLFI